MVRLLLLAAAAHGAITPAASASPDGCGSGNPPPEASAALEDARVGDLRPAEGLLREGRPGTPMTDLLRAQEAAARLDGRKVRLLTGRYLASARTASLGKAPALELIAETRFALGDYAAAARHARELLSCAPALGERQAGNFRQLAAIAEILSGQPAQEMIGPVRPGSVPMTRDRVGLPRAETFINGTSQMAVIDTGANLSVVSESAAGRLGLRRLQGRSRVSDSTMQGVDVELAIADEFEIAGARLKNVVFLVIADRKLDLPVPGGYRIDAIVGFPVFHALGRVRFGPGDQLAVELPVPGPAGVEPNLQAVGSDLYVYATIGGVTAPFFLDTGANRSSLLPRYAAQRGGDAAGESQSGLRSGLGGSVETSTALLHDVDIEIGNARGRFDRIALHRGEATSDEPRWGILGIDLLGILGSFTIDLVAMTFEAGAGPSAAEGAR